MNNKDDKNNPISASVVISCYDLRRVDWIKEAVDSLTGQTQKPKEIIVVFDYREGLEKLLRRNLSASVMVVRNKFGRGLSLARNTGIDLAAGDITAFLDDDAVAEVDWLANLISPFSDPHVVGVGGRAVPDWLGSGKRPDWFPEELDWTVGCMHREFGDNKRAVRNVFGCNMGFRTAQLKMIKGFDCRLGGPISGDDTDICLRITGFNEHYRIIYEPRAVVHHKVPEKRQTIRHISYSAWIQGVGKAVTRTLNQRDTRALASEKNYLRLLVFGFFPRQMLQVFSHPRRSVGKMAAALVVIISIASGYILTRLKIHKVNLDQYKPT
jgi:glucosyl-dolichyl phosphate glucuronosyltransferase